MIDHVVSSSLSKPLLLIARNVALAFNVVVFVAVSEPIDVTPAHASI